MSDEDLRVALDRILGDDAGSTAPPSGSLGRLERLCTTLARVLPATGVGVSLLIDDVHAGATVAVSDPDSRVLEELQFSLGEGPSIDAYATRRPVFEPDLEGQGTRRWPGYAPAAQQRGVRAVFAFPLQVGSARAGAMDIYRSEVGSLAPSALDRARTFADVAMGLLVDTQARATADAPSTDLDGAMAHRLEVYQAQGMVMVDLDVGLDEAMARLRAFSYSEGRAISDVAKDIVDGKLVLERDST
ncbi:GAF and ANTAR domain-containing protein [Knoellia sp. CPCC 206435]|uniref:GAF and ANTAR domain-containing protein n=1 Tax=Knoellia terrae TaxID=3404797 RepID=UPI003B43C5B2